MDGIINIKKSSGVTSFDCVAAVRKILGASKVGHAGTLDPEANGVLPVLVGKATKLSDVFLQMKKSYRGRILLGKATDTQDIWGSETENADASRITQEVFEKAVLSFKGPQLQKPPAYSALKINGKPMYKYAREGKEIEAEERPINVYDIVPGKLEYKDTFCEADIDVTCSRGTYIRTLLHDIGKKCGVPACMCALTRTSYGPLKIGEAITIEELEHLGRTALLPIESVLGEFRHEELTAEQYKRYINTGKTDVDDNNGAVLRYGNELVAILVEGRTPIRLTLKETEKQKGVALGNYDGVHIGHCMLLNVLKEECEKRNLEPFAYTFTQSIKPGSHIMSNRKKIVALNQNGTVGVIEDDFTDEYKSMSPEKFAEKILIGKLGAKLVVIGFDYTFGKDRAGNAETMKQLGEKLGFETIVVPEVVIDGEKVSSTRLKKAITEGRTEDYYKLTGRYYTVNGTVSHGRSVGSKVLGFPTANILPKDQMTVKNGVYATLIKIKGDGKLYKGVTNVGTNPTFDAGLPVSVETHIIGLRRDIYDKKITVSFVRYLRNEKKFDSPEELREQIAKDIEAAKK